MQSTIESAKVTKAEAHFRAMAFRIAYNNIFADVGDVAMRFGCAIAYSAKEILNQQLIETWWAWTGGKSVKLLLDCGKEPPAELRPFVQSYLRALGERARQTGDSVTDLI